MTLGNVTIFEVGPRDGLQNEKRWIETACKIRLIDLLSKAGFKKIEATSFVSPKWVPQMRDALEVMTSIWRRPGTTYTSLTPNLHGYEAARSAHVDEVAVFAAASEAFSLKNINCTIVESIERFKPVMQTASSDGIPVRGYVSCVTDCPYAGKVDPRDVCRITEKLLEIGCHEVSLGDTIGAGTPETVDAMLDAVLNVADASKLAGHFHNTQGCALDNIAICLKRGLRCFDSAIGGLGGCPFAPGAQGNVATEDVALMLESLGYVVDLDRHALAEASAFARALARD